MIEYSVNLCYGIVVPANKMQEFKEVLTDDEYDEMIDNYSRCINSWTGDDYFIGVMTYLGEGENDFVFCVSSFSIPSDDDKNLINFKQFFDEHNLWGLIDWKPELLLINFCY